MKKWIRVLFSLLLLLVVVVGAAITVLTLTLNPNQLKPVIASEIKKQTGYDAIIDGEFSWSFYPRIGVKAERIALLVPRQNQPFIDLQGVTFVTALSDLLHGKQKLRGDIYVSTGKLFQLQAQNIHVGLRWQGEELILQPIQGRLYDGQLQGEVRGRQMASVPRWDWQVELRGFQVRPLLYDVSGGEDNLALSGEGRLRIQAQATGTTREQFIRSINGEMEVEIDQGVLYGVDLNYLVQTADDLMAGKSIQLPPNLNQTQFHVLNGKALIQQGVVSVRELTLTSPAFMTRGVGSISLPAQIINMQLRVSSHKSLEKQWVIPIMITGNLYRPHVRLDVTELNIMLAKEKLEKVKEKIDDRVNEVKEKLSAQANVFVQEIFGK